MTVSYEKWLTPMDDLAPAYRAMHTLEFGDIIGFTELIVENFYSLILANKLLAGDAIDAGANAGRHSSRLALLTQSRNKRVVIVEPNEEMHPLIKGGCEAEMCNNFTIISNPVSDKNAEILEFVIFDDTQISSLKENIAPEHANIKPKRIVSMQTITLDKIVEQHQLQCAFIKLDIEGKDFVVLNAIGSLLQYQRPFIAAEVMPTDAPQGMNFKDLFDTMTQHDYLCVDGFGHVYSPELWSHHYGFMYWNRFFIPAEWASLILPAFRKAVAELWRTQAVMRDVKLPG